MPKLFIVFIFTSLRSLHSAIFYYFYNFRERRKCQKHFFWHIKRMTSLSNKKNCVLEVKLCLDFRSSGSQTWTEYLSQFNSECVPMHAMFKNRIKTSKCRKVSGVKSLGGLILKLNYCLQTFRQEISEKS